MVRRLGATLIALDQADAFAYEALLVGSTDAPCAGNCSKPVIRSFTGAISELELLGLRPMPDRKYRFIDLEVRCRRCADCLRARSAHWAFRAQSETAAASRSWFGTLTLHPNWQFHCKNVAHSRIAAMGAKWHTLTPDDQFSEIVKPLRREIQLFMKRLRKSADGLRFITVIERHKSGDPHVHILIHENRTPIRHNKLTAAWKWGFTKFNLVAEDHQRRAARYVCKYLAKEAVTRVVASLHYGDVSFYDPIQ